MSLLDGGLQNVFGAAFGAIYLDATLIKGAATDTGTGGYSVVDTTHPVKAMAEVLSDRARAASGLPDTAVAIRLLRAAVMAAPALDDRVGVSGLTYRVIRVEGDPAQAAWTLVCVPVPAA